MPGMSFVVFRVTLIDVHVTRVDHTKRLYNSRFPYLEDILRRVCIIDLIPVMFMLSSTCFRRQNPLYRTYPHHSSNLQLSSLRTLQYFQRHTRSSNASNNMSSLIRKSDGGLECLSSSAGMMRRTYRCVKVHSQVKVNVRQRFRQKFLR
jgi:hypothetical protein